MGDVIKDIRMVSLAVKGLKRSDAMILSYRSSFSLWSLLEVQVRGLSLKQ